MSFFEELKRRNVFKVAAAYIIVGWLIMQAGDTLAPALHLPDWVNSLLAFFLILGFPLAMFFAWAYEITPDGIKKEKEVDRGQSIAQLTGQKLNYTIMALMATALAYFAWDKFSANPENELGRSPATPTSEQTSMAEVSNAQTPDRKSIAVIPFRNRSANEENAEFFSDGVHDELLTYLSKIKALKVISRTSVMGYRDTTKNMRQIGEELGVATILEGGVQRAGDTVRINVQLIDAATDEHLWANIYDRQLTAENIFTIQSEIARAIADALHAALSPEEQARLNYIPTQILEAYDELLIARQLYDRGNWHSMRSAIVHLRKAIELDPDYSEAYALLARLQISLVTTGALNLTDVSAELEKTINMALLLDENNVWAHMALGGFLWKSDLDGAEQAFERALELDPNNAEAQRTYGNYLYRNFRPDRALPYLEQALRLDPVSSRVLFALGRAQEMLGYYEKARESFAKIREIDPTSSVGVAPMAGTYFLTGQMELAWFWIFKAMEIDSEDFEMPVWIVRGYTDFLDFETAARWLVSIETRHRDKGMVMAARAMLEVNMDRLGTAGKLADTFLKERLPNRWGAGEIMVRIARDAAITTRNYDHWLSLLGEAYPELFTKTPVVTPPNLQQAIDIALLMQHAGMPDAAESLLRAAIAAYDIPYATSGSINAWRVPAKAEALALLGESQAALTELRRVVDGGWRLFWRWETELNPNFDSLRDQPEFKQIVQWLRSDMARQLESLRAMEAAGEIPSPPGGEG